jgi:alkylation response protein AidB-like acyl-CoA dehydrogenase
MGGAPGDGIRILDTVFSATAALVGAFAVGVMRAAFEAALAFATAERRGGPTPIIEHRNVGTILVDIKARLEAARYLTWKACDYFDRTGGAGTEIAVLTKIFSSEAPSRPSTTPCGWSASRATPTPSPSPICCGMRSRTRCSTAATSA